MTKVAYLGPEASYTHQAALASVDGKSRHYFQGLESIPDVFAAVEDGKFDLGVVPVENSTEGVVTATFDLLANSSIQIVKELCLPIHHQFLVKDLKEEVKVLYSHPQAFGQTRHWLLENYPECEHIESSSTSAAAKLASETPNSAALSGILAAEIYDLKVKHENIEDFSDNKTRFLVIGKESVNAGTSSKTSLMFALKDEIGILYDALLPFKNNQVNLTMIQSRPSKQKNWEYIFFVDFLGHISEQSASQAIRELQDKCEELKVLGSYPCL
ncbi:MAG: prephenate dehydratase [Lentisphaeria bacterium]|nr:prephenate dehydratase [Lentisphaeria bacterium]